MIFRSSIALLFTLVCSFAFAQQPTEFQPEKLRLEWELVENQYQGAEQTLSRLTLTNDSKNKLLPSGWGIYFNFGRSFRPEATQASGFEVKQLSGDWFRLRPTDQFGGLAPGQSCKIDLVSSDWLVHRTDAPNGFYLVFDREPDKGYPLQEPVVKGPTDPRKLLRSAVDKKMPVTSADIYAQNQAIGTPDMDKLCPIFPTPMKWSPLGSGVLIGQNTPVWIDPSFANEGLLLEENWRYWFGGINLARADVKEGVAVTVRTSGEALPNEGYKMSITPEHGIEIWASSPAGAFYGIQSLSTMVDPDALQQSVAEMRFPCIEVIDQPRFAYRGLHIDVARHFQTKSEILKMLDVMALYKLNTLHFHFSDDEGWRIEIPGLPELTEVGARRGHASNEQYYLHPAYGSGPTPGQTNGSGYYSRQDFVEILRYAADRHIRVIPEIELPGHARAAIKSMDARYERLLNQGKPEEARRYLLRDLEDRSAYTSVQGYNDNVVCVGLASTYVFIEKVVDELLSMYHDAGAPIETMHLGGDEVPAGVWELSPVCRKVRAEQNMTSTEDLWYLFWAKMGSIMSNRGLQLSGWEEVGMRQTRLDDQPRYIPNPDFVGNKYRLYVWNNVIGWGSEDLAYRMANAGYPVVLGPVSNLYFDMAYQKDFDEPGYYWGAYTDVEQAFSFAPYDYFKTTKTDRMGNPLDPAMFKGKERLTDYGKSNILGMEGLIWSETLNGPNDLEYMVIPKLLGLAERAWAPTPGWETARDPRDFEQQYAQAWTEFVYHLGQTELPRLDYLSGGFNYRIPTPGAVVRDGKALANIQFPGLTLRYTTDGQEPTVKSAEYKGSVKAVGTVKIRAFNRKGRSSRTVQAGL